jgi:hypothetical protein
LEFWNNGIMGIGTGMLEYWNNGTIEKTTWNTGKLE